MYKLGKRPARIDRRTLPFKCLLKKLPSIPENFDLEADMNFPCKMWENDTYGDCVIVGRTNHTLRLEYAEQGKYLNISDEEVLEQYWKEGRRFCFDKFIKPDRGLVMLDSMKAWRKGWVASGKKYNIYAFAETNKFDKYETKAALYLLNGLNIGLALPNSYGDQDIWSDTSDPPNYRNGHCVYVRPFWCDGIMKVATWGKDDKYMTYEFYRKYCDEPFAVIDDVNKWLGADSTLDIPLLEGYLREVTK